MASREKLQERYGLTDAELDVVWRRTGGGKGDVEAEAEAVLGERVGPAKAQPEPAPASTPRRASTDELDARVSALEGQLAALRAERDRAAVTDLRVSAQGVAPEPPATAAPAEEPAMAETATADESGKRGGRK